MSVVRPYKAIRPDKKYADKVVSLPYDVMNRAEAKAMASENKYSFLNICRSEICLPDSVSAYDRSVYEKARDNIKDFLDQGIFVREEKPVFYIYRQEMNGNVQTGIVATVSIDEYENNTIKKHELTRVEKEKDRINHFDVCNANTEPVFLTYRDEDEINQITNDWVNNHEAEYDFTTDDGVKHELWVMDDDALISRVNELFKGVSNLYIADGHHRSASAFKVGKKRREENPDYKGDEEFNFFEAVIFPAGDLKVFDYNRVVKDLNGRSDEEFMSEIQEKFIVEEKGESEYRPESKHDFGMFINGKWYKLTAKEGTFDENDPIESLDVNILQENLLHPILSIEDPRTDNRIDFVGGIRGLKELERRVNEDMKVAFAVHPVSIDDLLRVSDADLIMPPKSTWFEPKLGSGLFIHEL